MPLTNVGNSTSLNSTEFGRPMSVIYGEMTFQNLHQRPAMLSQRESWISTPPVSYGKWKVQTLSRIVNLFRHSQYSEPMGMRALAPRFQQAGGGGWQWRMPRVPSVDVRHFQFCTKRSDTMLVPAGFRRLLWPPLPEHYQLLCLLTCLCNQLQGLCYKQDFSTAWSA